ncbi:ABC transporter permease [Achromobacter aegrifaciens]|uniref:ABC transporter permease n=1 Tax=Achromobacter aegrifaciens TaxID=1287736 RepID=UPI0028A6A501|nr:ABC transporter permease [Achromobacter aegrifaciens]
MLGYLLKRIAASVPTVIVVTVLVFALIRAIPGDPASLMLGDIDNPALLAEMRHALQGDLGMSIARREPVMHLVLTHFAVTAQVVLTATLLACLVAVPAGMVAAWRQNRRADTAIVSTSILFVSMPSFWVGILLIWLFGVKLNWLPVYGFESIAQGGLGAARYLVLPVCAIVLTEIAAITRMMRASTIETLRLEYVAHARAKGLPEKRVMLRHVLPNSFGPTLTVIGLMLGHLLSGAAVIETVFTLPGIGRLLVESIYARDYPVVQGCLLFIALLYVAVNLVVDLLYPLFDPRVKLQ